MNGVETAMLAGRLLAVSTALLLVPGLAMLALLRLRSEWPERIVMAFAASYVWMFILSILVPLAGATVDYALAITIVLAAALIGVGVRHWRRNASAAGRVRPIVRSDTLLVLAIVIGSIVAGWINEPPFTGEEALDVASISRFADGGRITFENTSLFPGTRPVYLFQPYQLAVAMVARASRTDPVVAFLKFRAFLAPLAAIFLYSLLRRLAATQAEAVCAFIVVAIFVVLDVQTWEWNSLFPFVRRGGFSAGLCVPALMVLCLTATRRAEERAAHRIRAAALAMAPGLLVASLATHPLEMFTVLCFAGGIALVTLAGIDRGGDRRYAAALMLLLAVTAGAYVSVQSQLVPYVAEHEREAKRGVRADLTRLSADPVRAIIGRSEARDLLSRTIPSTTAIVFGIPALALAALRTPVAAATLAMGIVPLALVYAAPAGLMVLTLLTSVATVKDVNAYFSLLGLLSLALGITALAHAVLRAAAWRQDGFRQVVVTTAVGSVVLVLGWTVISRGADWLAARTITQPEVGLGLAVAVAIAVLTIARASNDPRLKASAFSTGVVVVAAAFALVAAMPERAFGGPFARREPVTILERLRAARATPSIMQWPKYYELLKDSIAPSLPVPREVVDELRARMPPRQVLLANPLYSCALVVLLDAYCINPASIYGHYFQPAASYFERYVTDDGADMPRHPFYNDDPAIADTERALLGEYGVSYILADPPYAEAIARKLRMATVDAALVIDKRGYRLYRIEGR